MTEAEKLRQTRARLVEAQRCAADSALNAPSNTRLPAESLARIQGEIDAIRSVHVLCSLMISDCWWFMTLPCRAQSRTSAGPHATRTGYLRPQEEALGLAIARIHGLARGLSLDNSPESARAA